MAKRSASVRRELARDDEVFDVPAAVLCACCGQPDCAGCSAASDEGSGVVAIIPWERTIDGVWSRLWATSKATTLGAETFFAAIHLRSWEETDWDLEWSLRAGVELRPAPERRATTFFLEFFEGPSYHGAFHVEDVLSLGLGVWFRV